MARSAGISQSTYTVLMDAYAKTGIIASAAKVAGIHPNSAREYIRGNYKPAPDNDTGLQSTIDSLRRELDTTKQALKDAVRPRYTIRADNVSRGDKVRVVVIGDAHDSPHIPDKSRFRWLGKHVADTKPDFVIQIGDIATMDSVSSHTGNHTIEGKTKPKLTDDINSLNLALDAFNDGLGSYNVPKHITLGNHERRVFAYENEHPEIEGMPSHLLDQCLKERGWTYSPYGQPHFVGGVGFLHAAINRMGKTFGGKTSENQIANESVTDVVIGHSHIKRVVKFAKLHHRHITVVNAGCALPHGYVENYAQHAMTGWSYGVMTLTIKDNHITDDEWVSMETLGERYA
jgi:hypothetical protein